MEPTSAKKKIKKQRPLAIHGERSRHDDMLRTHYPKSCPTYLVAFSLKETYDDLATAQQKICKHATPEHSPQESTHSITPTGSFKIVETELDKLNVSAENKRLNAEHSPQESTNSITLTGSFNILESDFDKSNIIAKNKILSPEHSPQERTKSMPATGSYKILKTELEQSNKIPKNILSSPGYSPYDSTNSITPIGPYKILKTELEPSNIIPNNIISSPEHSPHDSTNSITPTGSFNILKTELNKSYKIAKIKHVNIPITKQSPDSLTPKDSFTVLETEQNTERSQVLDENHSENKTVSIENSVHSSIYSTNSSTPTSSLKFASSDYSSASRITIGEKQKVTIDFTALGTNSDEPSSTECTDITENVIKYDVVTQNPIRREVVSHELKEVGDYRQNKENVEKYITVYVYNESDKMKDKDNTGDTDNTAYTVDSGNNDDTDKKGNFNYEELNCVSDKINEDMNLTQDNRKNNKEPESIFKAVRKNHAPKKKRSFRRKSAANIKQKKFKCKITKKKIDARFQKYYEKRNNSIDAYQVQVDLCSDEVSTIVSRTQVVHKKARENLLENSEINTASDFEDVLSLTSSLTTATKTLMSISDSSQNTLVQEPSAISNVTDILDMITVNQDIEVDHVSSLLKMTNVTDIYKSQVVSIPVTVAYDRSTVSGSKNENHLLASQENSEEICTLVKLPLTDCEGVLPLIFDAMSEINEPSSDNFDEVTIKPSNRTLMNKKSSFEQRSSNDFYNARTSSQFSNCLDSNSTRTLTIDKNTIIDVESTTEDSVLNKEAMIFETVINLDRCEPSTSSNQTSYDDLPYFNDIIVANVPNDKHSTYRNHSDNKNKDEEKINNRKTILTKTTDNPTEKVPNKMLNLPNQIKIKAMLREREMPQLKCGDEMRNPPNIVPLWERVMTALEMAVHRLEDNLVEKIMKEIQKTMVKYPEQSTRSPELITKAEQAATISDYENLSVQCDLVKNTAIDKIIEELSSEGPKIKEPNTLHKVDLYNDIEVIISPDTTRTLTEKGDQNTISTLTSDSLKIHHRLSWLASVPVGFIRENMLVITSVPTFFVFMLCIYGLIQFLMKPW